MLVLFIFVKFYDKECRVACLCLNENSTNIQNEQHNNNFLSNLKLNMYIMWKKVLIHLQNCHKVSC